MHQQELCDNFLGQVYLHPHRPIAYQVIGWIPKNEKETIYYAFLRPIRLLHLFTPYTSPAYYKLNQDEIKTNPLLPANCHTTGMTVMYMQRMKNTEDIVEYTLADETICLTHCKDYTIPFVVYAYKSTGNNLAYHGSQYMPYISV